MVVAGMPLEMLYKAVAEQRKGNLRITRNPTYT
jgi:hypothetical protein